METYVGEIILFAPGWAPWGGWRLCDGSLLKITEYTTLFAFIGTRFGGDGITNFALPDLRSRIPLGQSVTNVIGQRGGFESVALSLEALPRHGHIPACSTSDQVNSKDATNAFWSASTQRGFHYAPLSGTGNMQMNFDSIAPEGAGYPHENRMPVLAVAYLIATTGIFPSQD